MTHSMLIPKADTKFQMKEVEIKETYNIITGMSKKNARGFDFMNRKVLNMIPPMSSLWLNHLFNGMVRTGRLSSVPKVTHILPI